MCETSDAPGLAFHKRGWLVVRALDLLFGLLVSGWLDLQFRIDLLAFGVRLMELERSCRFRTYCMHDE